MSTNSVKVGEELRVYIRGNAKSLKYTLIRMGSVTHSVNTDQRRIPLTNVSAKDSRAIITLPSDSGILLPGMYYLFVINEQGVPSIAQTIQVRC
jgi:galactose oxidase